MKTNKLKQQKGTLLRVLQYVKPYRVLVIVSLLCACVSAAAQLLIPILTGKAIDQMIGAGQVNLSGRAGLCGVDWPSLRRCPRLPSSFLPPATTRLPTTSAVTCATRLHKLHALRCSYWTRIPPATSSAADCRW